MIYSLNSLQGDYVGGYIGACYGFMKGDTRSLDYGSCRRESVMTFQVHSCG